MSKRKEFRVFYWIVMPLFVAGVALVLLLFSALHLWEGMIARAATLRPVPVAAHTYDAALAVETAACVLELLIMVGCLGIGLFFWKRRGARDR